MASPSPEPDERKLVLPARRCYRSNGLRSCPPYDRRETSPNTSIVRMAEVARVLSQRARRSVDGRNPSELLAAVELQFKARRTLPNYAS